jgi:hypothetical protein
MVRETNPSTMTYTLWSRGRLLGESDLGYARCLPRHRMGTLHPTDVGDRLLPVAAGVSAAGIAFGRAFDRLEQAGRRCSREQCVPEHVDLVSAVDEREALAMELRGPDGAVIPTEWIDVRDVAFLLSLAREPEPDPEPESEGDPDDGPWDPDSEDVLDEALVDEEWHSPTDDVEDELPEMRFQLQVMLLDDTAVP